MLLRYNNESTASPSYDSSWAHSDALLNPAKDNNNDYHIFDIPAPLPLPRAKIATVQRRPLSAILHSRSSLQPPIDYISQPHQRPISEINGDFRYNIPLEERFYQDKLTDRQAL